MKTFETYTPQETFAIGRQIGEAARKGQVYALLGDLGTGKTVLSQGVAAGLGITGIVNSPTFTIVQVYDEGRLPFYHFDVYRIEDIEEMQEIGYEEYFYGEGVCLVEWADLMMELMPEDTTIIRIEKVLDKGFDYRRITVEGNERDDL
ncbi:MAG: tRNA (adenosine(37)-N6)-threonylcarbamoyltransferase complex ATPase subunit type 1 TsaE [Lachnospiraceae bacterium]